MYKHTEFLSILDKAIESKGEIALPNVQLIEDPAEALKLISHMKHLDHKAYQFRIMEYDPPRGHQKYEVGYYVKIYLHTAGMAGQFDGQGVILYNGKAYRFSMCDHQWDESGANHSRGWHPAHCTKCGFDASIDSGD